MNDSRDFQDDESVRSGQSHVTSQPAFSHLFKNPGGMLSRSSRNDGPPSIWDTHGISGNVFANPTASSSAPYPQVIPSEGDSSKNYGADQQRLQIFILTNSPHQQRLLVGR